MSGRTIAYGLLLSAPFWLMAGIGFALGRVTA